MALEKAKTEKEAHGEFESECPGYCGAQDTFYVGNMKGVGRIYQQTFIDTYTKVVFAKLYDRKTPITAADILNDRVLPFFEEHESCLCRVLTDRGTEYCGNPEHHDYELYLAVEDIDHYPDQDQEPADQRNLRAVPSNRARRVLSCGVPQEASIGPIDELQERSRCLGDGVQRNAPASGTMVLSEKPRCKPSLTQPRSQRKN